MDNIGAYVVPAAIALVAISIVARGIRIVQQAQTMIIERLGKYHRTLSSGVNLIIPIIDKPRAIDWHQVIVTPAGDSFARHFRTDKIDLRETVYVFPRQNVITKDNVVVEIVALIYSQITDPVRATYEIANLPDAIEKLTQTTLRNVIGEMELDHAVYLIAICYIEALKNMVTSPQSNKFIYLPYEATGVLSSLGGIREMLAGTTGEERG